MYVATVSLKKLVNVHARRLVYSSVTAVLSGACVKGVALGEPC